MRQASLSRTTAETDISLTLNLDGQGRAEIDTGVGFLDHMLTLFAKHGRFDLTVTCRGDTNVDDHHSVEDVGIVLGEAFARALGDKRGIRRFGDKVIPMDEALILTAIDLSGRSFLGYALSVPTEKIGTFDTELVKEFWLAFVRKANVTLHIRQMAGENSHHIVEGMFKSAGRTFRAACTVDPDLNGEVLSRKGGL